MTFSDKLKELRKRKNITQDELAKHIYVSRTAVSKWESGKGYPSIDTLRLLADFYEVSIDELISNEEILKLSSDNLVSNKLKFKNMVIALLDIVHVLFLFLPIFAKQIESQYYSVMIYESASGIVPFILYFTVIGLSILNGLATLVLINFEEKLYKHRIPTSLILNLILVGVFLLTKQPYPGILALLLLVLKLVIVFKK